jgi:uncharacterized membrane protein
VFAETQNPLSANEGLTITVRLNKGVLTPPSQLTQLIWFVRSNGIVLLPFVAFAVMFTLWWKKGRDPNAGISVAPQYEPPKDMSPAEVGTLIDDSTDPRDISSILVDLAVRGFVLIKEEVHETLKVFKSTEYVFKRLKPPSEWEQLAPYERAMLDKLFSGGDDEVRLSELRNSFYIALPTIKEGLMSSLKSKGMYYVDPASAKGYWLLGGLLIIAPFLLIHWFTNADFFTSPGLAVIAIILTLIIFVGFGHYMTAKSMKGARTVVHIKGFEEFMNRVDADRLQRMSPADLSSTFEKFLPYAMALGVEQRWAKAFRGLLTEPPGWYQGYGTGPGYFDPYLFSHSLGTMSTAAMQTFASAPRAQSSGSGWGGGGGGFSGGGFGGGGGDAF